MPNALLVIAPGFEEIEAITVIDLLRRGNVEVTVTGTEKGLIKGSHDISIQSDCFYEEINQEEFDILILPGGQPGTNNLRKNPVIIKWVRNRFQNKQKLAAICAAPTVFEMAGITANLRLTSYPSEKEIFKGSKYMEENVVKDDTVITSRGVGTAIDFALALIAELQGDVTAKEVGRKILHEIP